jgi:hypothetical protein
MARKIKVNMTGVESYIRAEQGEHIARLKEIEEGETQNGNPKLTAKFEVTKGSSTGATVYETFTLTDKVLWKLKMFLEAVGVNADGKIVLNLDNLIGKSCIVSVFHEEYNGSLRAKIDSFKKLEAKSEEADDDDEDEDGGAAFLDFFGASSSSSKKKPEPEEDEDDDDEEDEPAPKKKSKPEPKPTKKKPVDEDDDDDWDED